MSTIALGSQCFSRANTSLRVLTSEHPRPQSWRAVSPELANALRLEAATASYFLSLTDDELRTENELGDALGNSTGFIDFDE